MKKQFVQLKEIPEQGHSFNYDSKTEDEIRESLKDLIGQNDYKVTGHIQDLGELFEISGEINTTLDTACCKCNDEMSQKFQYKFKELLLVTPKALQSEKAAKANHSSDLSSSGTYCNELNSSEFDLPEFIHEQIAANEPSRPMCGDGDNCLNAESIEKYFINENTPRLKPDNPFAALESLKTDKKIQ